MAGSTEPKFQDMNLYMLVLGLSITMEGDSVMDMDLLQGLKDTLAELAFYGQVKVETLRALPVADYREEEQKKAGSEKK